MTTIATPREPACAGCGKSIDVTPVIDDERRWWHPACHARWKQRRKANR